MTFDFEYIQGLIPIVFLALPTTLLVTGFPAIFGALLGLINALSRMYNIPVLKQISLVLNSYVRGVPLFVQLFLGFYGFPKFINIIFFSSEPIFHSKTIPPIVTALIIFTLYATVYLSETIRGGLLSVDMLQMDAAHSIGMTKFQAFIRIIIPQAVVVVIPNYFNFVLSLLKNSSLVFGILVMDVMAVAKTEAESGLRYIETYVLLAIVYVTLGGLVYIIFKQIEKRVKSKIGGLVDAK